MKLTHELSNKIDLLVKYDYFKKRVCNDDFRRSFGAEMKAVRLSAGIGLREMSRYGVDVAASYVSDFERGSRSWSLDLVNKYVKYCQNAVEVENGRQM